MATVGSYKMIRTNIDYYLLDQKKILTSFHLKDSRMGRLPKK